MTRIEYEQAVKEDAAYNWRTLIAAVTALSVRDARRGDPDACEYLAVCAPDALNKLQTMVKSPYVWPT